MSSPNSWLEVSLIVNGELAEAAAEVMARYAPSGVVIESTAVETSGEDPAGHPVGPLRVCAYLAVDSQLEDTRQKLEESLWHLGQIAPLPELSYKTIEQANWMESWKQHYHPIPVGRRLLILPAWLENPDPSRTAIKIDPGMAFGTGTHPTTQLSLELLEAHLQPGQPVLDIGSGSGILAIAARKLGASAAYGVDVDPDSIENAQTNAAQNEVREGIAFAVGSVAAVKDGLLPIQQAPLVIANILAHILIRLIGEGLPDLVAPGGALLLSGILEGKEAELQEALSPFPFEILQRLQIDDWVALAARRRN